MDIMSHLPNLPSLSVLKTDLSHLPECLHDQLARLELPLTVEKLQIAGAGLVLVLLLLCTIAYKRLKRKPDETKPKESNEVVVKLATGIPKPWKKPDLIVGKKFDEKSEPKTWKKPFGVKSSKDANIPSTSSNKLKTPEQTGSISLTKEFLTNKEEKPSWSKSQKKTPEIKQEIKMKEDNTPEEKKKVGLFAPRSEETNKVSLKEELPVPEEKSKKSWATKTEAGKEAVVHKRQLIIRPERDEKKEAEEFEKELKETERKAEAEAKRFMKPINLNIDTSARSRVESKKDKEKELNLVRKMCEEFRDVAKLDGNEEKEEKRKEMDKVRSARSYFKTVDKYRSESMSAVPRMKIRSEEDFNDNFSRGSQMRLSQFEPGKINSKFSNIFGGDCQTDCEESLLERQRPPKKKLITLDQVIKKSFADDEETQNERDRELEELRQARKNWVPPEENTEHKGDIASFSKLNTMPVKNRWNPVNSDRQEKTQSLEVPQKLNNKNVFVNDSKVDTGDAKTEVEKELNEIREARPTPLSKRWKPKQYQKPAERSKSAHVLQRVKLADNSWVVEKSESRLEEERRKASQELEFVKKVRMESLEVIENVAIERPSSRQEQSRFETMKELEEVKKARTEAKSYEPDVKEMAARSEINENVMEKQNVEKIEKTKSNINSNTYENSEVKCVRFDETHREKEASVDENTEEENPKFETKVRQKLKQIKQQTEQEVSKLTHMKSKPLQNIENEKERARELVTGDSPGHRNRSLSRIRTAGQKVKDLTNEQLKKITKTKPKKNAKA